MFQVYKHPKVHGTRFVGHQQHGLKVLLSNWVLLIQIMENLVASPGTESAKIKGFLNKLADAKFLIAAVLLKQILDVAAQASKKFERQDLLMFDVPCIIELCMNDIDCIEHSLKSENFELEGEQLC